MKVLQINTVCGTGSTGKIATDIHNILIYEGHKSLIAYGREIPKNCDNKVRIGTKYDNYAHVLKTRIFDRHGFGSVKATEKFIEKINAFDPDIIHLHNVHGYYINVEILFEYLKHSDKKIVWTLHDCWAFTGHCTYFDSVGCDKWKNGCFSCPQKLEYPKSFIFDNSSKNYLDKKTLFTGLTNIRLVTPSKWLASVVKNSFLKRYPINVIYNGIDKEVFKPTHGNFRNRNSISEKYVLLGVANGWVNRKGLNDFIELSKRLPDGYLIVLVGLSKQQIKDLPSNILGIERTNNIHELAEIYTTSNVYLNLSVEETMGLTTVEALACGTPVIVYNATAIPEVVNSSCGRVIQKNNISELERVITDRVVDKLEAKDCISTAMHFEKNEKFQMYISLYKELLGEVGGEK